MFCRTRSNGTKSRRWTFPDGTTCHAQHHGASDIAYCIAGRCERFSCDNATGNFFKMDTGFCATREPRPAQRQTDATPLESSKHSASYYSNNKPRSRYENGE